MFLFLKIVNLLGNHGRGKIYLALNRDFIAYI